MSGYICGATVTDTKIKDTTFPGTGFNGALIGHANDGKTEMTNVTVSGVTDGSQQKIHVVGTNYASGKDHTITITGGSTYVDAAGILQSALGDNNVAVSGGSYTFAIPVDQIDTGKVSVTFKNGEKIVIVQVIATGGTVTPPTMSDDGASIFDGWYLEDGVTRITSSTTFRANTVATPKWTELAITLSQSSLSIVQGGTATLTATVTPATAPDKTVTWSTSDSAIATIDNGTVIAVAPGTATITAAVDGKSASCTVTVTAAGMVIPAVEEPKTDTDQISDSADKQTASDVAKTVAADETITSAAQSAATELNNSSEKSDLIEKGNQDLNPSEGKEVTLYTQTYLQIEATELSKDEENSAITSITLNITPMMQVVASTATNSADIKLDSNGETNAVVVQDPKELEITTSAEITVKLPENFKSQTVYVKHQASNGGTYFYQAPADSTGKVTFTSSHGFSPFTFSLTNEAVAVVDGISYASFQEAVNAAADNDVVEVLKNESLTATVSGSSRTITVKNLTGNSITVTLNGQTMPIDNGATQEYTYTRPSGGGGVTTYAITVPSDVDGGAVKVSPTRASSGTTVTITVTPDDGYELAKLTVTDKDGDTVKLTDKGDGKYTFTMPASAVEVEASFQEIVVEPDNPFIDVYESDYYYEAVLWAVENGVTVGTSATTFSPDVTVSRAQMVTFLWRAYGSPEVTGENPFTDVSESEYYYDAVLWAVENGVTVGTTSTTFSPEAPVTRAQAVTFQWRAAGSPAASGDSFNDVADDVWYSDAVTWAVANEITNGTGGNNFSPEVAVSRAQAVTFLYRELA